MDLRSDFGSLEDLIAYIRRTPFPHLVFQFDRLPLVTKPTLEALEAVYTDLMHSKQRCSELGVNYRDPSPADAAVLRLTAYLALTNNIPLRG